MTQTGNGLLTYKFDPASDTGAFQTLTNTENHARFHSKPTYFTSVNHAGHTATVQLGGSTATSHTTFHVDAILAEGTPAPLLWALSIVIALPRLLSKDTECVGD